MTFWLQDFPDFFRTNAWGLALGLALAFILGLMIGSFLNVVIYRLPKMMRRQWHQECLEFMAASSQPPLPQEVEASEQPMTLAYPASHCPHCHSPVSYRDNIPILSYLLLRGKCRHCGTPVSRRYPLVELLCGLLTMSALWHFGITWTALAGCLFLWILIALTFIDIDWQLLPDQLTLFLLWAGLFFNLLGGFTPLSSAVIGAMAGYLLLWSVYWGFKLITGKEGMGYGDFKLLAALGAWFGWELLPVLLLISACVGAVIGIALIAMRGLSRQTPLPFGPYLALAGLIALFWRHKLLILTAAVSPFQ